MAAAAEGSPGEAAATESAAAAAAPMDTRKWDLDYSRFEGVDECPAPADVGFRTEMTWQNTATTTYVQVAVPAALTEADVAVTFEPRCLRVELAGVGERGTSVTLELGHPAVKSEICSWGLGPSDFGKASRPAVKCVLEKATSGPWDEVAFGATVQTVDAAAYLARVLSFWSLLSRTERRRSG